ncbi:MAG: 4Fe-4S binding protein, partial [Phycisphaerae bacterium]
FCTKQCRALFASDPERFAALRCVVCDQSVVDAAAYPATYLGRTYPLCSEAHRRQFKADPASYFMHTMWGIPSWLYYGSIALVLIVSFGVFDWIGRRESRTSANVRAPRRRAIGRDSIQGEGERLIGPTATSPAGTQAVALPMLQAWQSRSIAAASAGTTDRFDLLSVGAIDRALGSRVFRFSLQAVVVALFGLIVAAGLFGNQNPALNIAPMLTWTVWWGALVILILFAGKAWCYVCPWDAIAGWTEKLAFWRKSHDGLSLGLKWPRVIRNILLATILFVGLTWVELGFGVTMKPRVTAYLAIAMLLMAVVSAMLFDRKSFCRYACLVGRVSGLYALFSSTEVRCRSAAVCKQCHTKECVKGSDTAYGCPTFLYPGGLQTNTYCIQCMECVQACPHDNLAVNLRPWGSDLVVEGKPRADEAYLALLMLSITGFHGLTMTPVWQQLVDSIRASVGLSSVAGFSLGMLLLMLGPVTIYAALVYVSMQLGKWAAPKPLKYRDYFIRYAYALLPIALFYHIAHNLEHLLMEGPKALAMMSDPFGWGWNLLGTAQWTVPPLISLGTLWLIQVFMVLVGHVYSLWVAQKTSVRLFGSARSAFRSQLPMLLGMICFSVFSLWLLKQPMEMRTSAM